MGPWDFSRCSPFKEFVRFVSSSSNSLSSPNHSSFIGGRLADMSTLLHDVLRTQSQQLPADGLAARLNNIKLTSPNGDESTTTALNDDQPVRTPSPTSEEDELIQVVCLPPRSFFGSATRWCRNDSDLD